MKIFLLLAMMVVRAWCIIRGTSSLKEIVRVNDETDSESDKDNDDKDCRRNMLARDVKRKMSLKRFKRYVGPESRIWPEGVVPYEFDASYPEDKRRDVVRELEDLQAKVNDGLGKACIDIRPRAPSDDYGVFIIDDVDEENKPKCEAVGVGFQNARGNRGRQEISYGIKKGSSDDLDCLTKSAIQHEFMHALGFEHEHQRPDRDKYVKVWRENIDDEEYEDDYQKIFFGNNFGIDYDVLSVMHYPGEKDERFFKRQKTCKQKMTLRKSETWNQETRKKFYDGDDYDHRGANPNDIKKIRCFYKCLPDELCRNKPM